MRLNGRIDHTETAVSASPATGEPHPVAARFRLDRFATGHLLDEEGTGSQHTLH